MIHSLQLSPTWLQHGKHLLWHTLGSSGVSWITPEPRVKMPRDLCRDPRLGYRAHHSPGSWHWKNDLTFLHYMIEHWHFYLGLVKMVKALDKGAFNTPQWGLVIIIMYSYNYWCYHTALVTFDCCSDQTPDMRQLQGVRIYSGSPWGATVHRGRQGMEAKSEAPGHTVSCPQWRSRTGSWAELGKATSSPQWHTSSN